MTRGSALLGILRLGLRIVAAGCAVLLLLMGAAWLTGTMLIRRAEPNAFAVPDGVPGRLLAVGEQPVHVVERGTGPPLLLVHGLAGSTYDWEAHALDALAREHRVVAVDLWGMGFSARDDAFAYGYDLWVRQLVGTLDALGIDRAAVGGHSLGGALAVLLAAEHPERVDRVVLVSPLVPLESHERATFLRVLTTPGAGELVLGLRDLPAARLGFSDAHRERADAAFRIRGTRAALLDYVRHGGDAERLARAYASVHAPTLIVHGRDDDLVPYAAMTRWAPRIEHVTVLPLDGVGHWPLRDAPDRVVEAVQTFATTGS